MKSSLNTTFSLLASAADHLDRQAVLHRIRRKNKAQRGVRTLGRTGIDRLIPLNHRSGNLLLSGGGQDTRNRLIVQSCLQDASVGLPTLIVHEGNRPLEQMLQSRFAGQRYFRIINASNPYYDPIFRLGDTALCHLLSDAAPPDHPIGSAGALYLRALASLLRKKGVAPYVRMLANCPHDRLDELIGAMERDGTLSAAEANACRSDLRTGSAERADIEYFLQQLELQSPILAWKRHLSRCTSAAECVARGGILSLDASSFSKRAQLSLIAAEIAHCAQGTSPLRVVVDTSCLTGCEPLADTLKNSPCLVWTLSTPDLGQMTGGDPAALSDWLARSQRAVLFAHGLRTSELLSDNLGLCDQLEAVHTKAGNNVLGRLGYNFGRQSAITTVARRERVVAPEELVRLGPNGFILLDNAAFSLSRGTLR